MKKLYNIKNNINTNTNSHDNHDSSGNKKQQQQQQIFSIQLKINDCKINVPVYNSDNKQMLARRFFQVNNMRVDQTNLVAIQKKIIRYLENMLKSGAVQQKLKDKIRAFIKKQENRSNGIQGIGEISGITEIRSAGKSARKNGTKQKQNVQKQSHDISAQYTPFKIIQDNNKSVRRSPSSTLRSASKITPGLKAQQYNKVTKAIKRNYPSTSITTAITNINSIKKNNVDPDLVKAYDVIYNKSRQSEMKNMAKKFLEECGHFQKTNKDNNKSMKSNNKSVRIQPPFRIQYKQTRKQVNSNNNNIRQIQKQKSYQRYSPQNNKTIQDNIPKFQRSPPHYQTIPQRQQIHKIINSATTPNINQNINKQRYNYLINNNLIINQQQNSDIGVTKFTTSNDNNNIQQNSFINGLSRSRSGSKRHKIKYNIDQCSQILQQRKYQECKLRHRHKGSLSYGKLHSYDNNGNNCHDSSQLLMGHLYSQHDSKRLRNYDSVANINITRASKKYSYLSK